MLAKKNIRYIVIFKTKAIHRFGKVHFISHMLRCNSELVDARKDAQFNEKDYFIPLEICKEARKSLRG